MVILFPSVGEGVNNNHSNILANFFYNEGYSVLILGSHFQWEFLKSLEKGYKIGLIKDDVKYINILVNNSISYLSKKYDRVFLERTALGTSLGAYAVLFLAKVTFPTSVMPATVLRAESKTTFESVGHQRSPALSIQEGSRGEGVVRLCALWSMA